MQVGGCLAVVILCSVQFVDVLGVTEVVTALPSVLRDFGASRAAGALILTAYAMCFGGGLMFGARLGDRFGHRRVLLTGLVVFVLGSLICASAAWPAQLIIGRSVQGIAAALSVPGTLRLLTAVTISGKQRHRALSAWSATGAVAGASGYLLGGLLTDLAGWRTVFWVNLPVALLLGIAVKRHVPRLAAEAKRRLDLAGALLLTATVMVLVLAGSLLEPPVHLTLGVACLGASALGALAFVWVEKRTTDPLLGAATITNRHLRAGARAAFANTATTSSAIALATLQLQRVDHVSPTAAGLRLIPFSLGAIAGSRLAAPALNRASRPTTIASGLTTIAVGNLLLTATNTPGAPLSIAVAIAGVGIGLSSVAATALAVDVPAVLKATAAGAINTAAQLGTAIGVASALLITSSGDPRAGWALAALTAIAAAAITIAHPPRNRDSGQLPPCSRGL